MKSINLEPYTIATATFGGVGYAEMYALGIDKIYKTSSKYFNMAVRWILSTRKNGTVPYGITPPSPKGRMYIKHYIIQKHL